MNVIKEHFNSIHEMLNVIESRQNNNVMRYEHSSESGSENFTGTKSYEEAKELFQNGYTEILPKIKAGVSENLNHAQTEMHRKVSTNCIGYAPHVPNAIMGLPNSMILTEAAPQKLKLISIVAGITENCGTSASEFVKSGIAILNTINMLELQGYRVNLKVAFACATKDDESAFGTVTVKDYREHLDLQKLCFPIAHPSMFRRFGFKWLETVPGLTCSGWSWGYGRLLDDIAFIRKNFLKDNEVYIGLKTTRDCNYNANKIIKYIKKEIESYGNTPKR